MNKQIFAAVILSIFFIQCSICPAVNLKADIDKNSIVDFFDFAILAGDWRKNDPNLKGDITGDSHVDFKDVWELANCWLHRDPNLVGWWMFDEGSGAIVYDSARNNNGTVYGNAAWIAGRINGALNFDSVNDYVNIPDDDNSLDITSQITIAAWIKPNDYSYYYIVAKQPSGSAEGYAAGNYEFALNGSYLEFLHQIYAEGGDEYYDSTLSVTKGVWQHVAVTLKANESVKFYINGEPAGTSPQNTPFGIVNNEPVRIGRIKSDEYWFYGGIDDVRIYNRALSGTEIQKLYQRGVKP
jgi:large repetitive protein